MSIILCVILLIFKLPTIAKYINFNVSGNAYVTSQFKYQLLLLIAAIVTVTIVLILNSENTYKFISLGNLSAPANAVPIFGIKDKESWLGLGVSLSLFITLFTAVFIYLQVKGSDSVWGQVAPFLGWIILFSLMNSLSEEAIFRLGILGSLYEVMSPSNIMLVSAIIFGAVHYGGMPNGIVGMLMAGVLGWLLMKSVLETHGLFWAFFIHFLQDVVIFGGIILLNAKTSIPQASS